MAHGLLRCLNTVAGLSISLLIPSWALAQQPSPDLFSESYSQARNKFIQASGKIGGVIESYIHPLQGPDNGTLAIDVTLLGAADAKTFLVISSGTHGVEGFAGSAIQTGALRESLLTQLSPRTAVLMIHAINPYGFAYLRRYNENNVDLNRNFVDHNKPYPLNPGYEVLANILTPSSLSFSDDIKAYWKILRYWLKHDMVQLRSAVSSGQFNHHDGLFFGGHAPAWSNVTIRRIFEKYLGQAEQVIFLDIHTGLGECGAAEVITNERKETGSYQRAVKIWGDLVKTTRSGESLSTHVHGPIKLAIPKMAPNAEVTAATLEFGTVNRRAVLWSLRAENWLLNQGKKNHPAAADIKADLLNAFYPTDEEWRKKIWLQGKSAIEMALGYIGNPDN